jgi:hypothetical protein
MLVKPALRGELLDDERDLKKTLNRMTAAEKPAVMPSPKTTCGMVPQDSSERLCVCHIDVAQ